MVALQQLCCALYLADLLCLCAKKVAFGCLVYAELWWLQEDAEEKQGQYGDYTDKRGSPNGFSDASAVGRGASICWCCGEAHLIVDDQVDRAARRIPCDTTYAS